jgi:AcrR family transcriptional regulator
MLDSRDRILAAAAESFLLLGFRESRMANIAKEAEVSRAWLYRQFPTKETLLLALNDRVIDDARSVGLQLLKDTFSPALRLRNWLRWSLQSPWRQHAVRVVTMEDYQSSLLADEGATLEIIQDTASALKRVIRAGVKNGEFRADLKPADVVHTLQAMLMGLHRNNVSKRPLFEVKSEAQIKNAIAILLNGITK